MVNFGKEGSLIPSSTVLEAFGVTVAPVLLPGGQGGTFRAGPVVLKPSANEAEVSWGASVFKSIRQDGFRVPMPFRSHHGTWLVEGWEAWEYLEGVEEKGRWEERIAASRNFHAALSGVPDPGFLRTGQGPWSVADRVAWGEQSIEPHERVAAPLKQLSQVLRSVDLPAQVIHGDLGAGNILFCDGQAPAIIDFSPYWRPAGFALAVGVVDMMVWEGADESILTHVSKEKDIDQLLTRALIRRLVEVDQHYQQSHVDIFSDVDAYQPVVDVVCRRLQ